MKGFEPLVPSKAPGALFIQPAPGFLPLASRRVPWESAPARGGRLGSTLQPLPRLVAQTGQTERSAVFVHGDTSPAGRRPNGNQGPTGPRNFPSPLPKSGGPLVSPSRCAGQQRLAVKRRGGGAAVRALAVSPAGGAGGRRTEAGLSWGGGNQRSLHLRFLAEVSSPDFEAVVR